MMFDKIIGSWKYRGCGAKPERRQCRGAAVGARKFKMVQTCVSLVVAASAGRKGCKDGEQDGMQMRKIWSSVTMLGARLEIEVQCFRPRPQCSGSMHVKVETHD